MSDGVLALPNPLSSSAISTTGALTDDVAKVATEGAGLLSKAGRLARVGGKAVPFLGAAINGARSAEANSDAEAAVNSGLVSRDALNPLRAALTGYTASGLGGIFTMAATEVAGAEAFELLTDQYDVDPVMAMIIRPDFISDMIMDPSLNSDEWATVSQKYSPESMADTYADIQTRFELPPAIDLGHGRVVSISDAVKNDEILELLEDHYDDANNEKALDGLTAMRTAAIAEATAQHWLTTFRPEQDPDGIAAEAAAKAEAAAPTQQPMQQAATPIAAVQPPTTAAATATESSPPLSRTIENDAAAPVEQQNAPAPAAQQNSPMQNAFTQNAAPQNGNNLMDGMMGALERNGAYGILPILMAIGSFSTMGSGGGMGGMLRVMMTTALVGVMIWGAEKMGFAAPGIDTDRLKNVFSNSANGQNAAPATPGVAQTSAIETEQDVARRTGVVMPQMAPG